MYTHWLNCMNRFRPRWVNGVALALLWTLVALAQSESAATQSPVSSGVLYDFEGSNALSGIQFQRCAVHDVTDSELLNSKALDLKFRRGSSGVSFELPADFAQHDLLIFDQASKSGFDGKYLAIIRGNGERFEQPLTLGSGDVVPVEVDLRPLRAVGDFGEEPTLTLYFHKLPKDFKMELDNIRLEKNAGSDSAAQDPNLLLLHSFERPSSRGQVAGNRVGEISLSRDYSSEGQQALRVQFHKGDDSHISVPIPYDWSEYDYFKLDIRNDTADPANFYLYFRDGFGKKYTPVVNVGPDTSETISMPIETLREHVDPEALEQFKVYFWGAPDDIVLLIDNLRLTKGKETQSEYEQTQQGDWTILASRQAETQPVASAAQQAAGFIPYTDDYMVRLYPATVPTETQLNNTIDVCMARDEFEPFIVGVWALEDIELESVEVSSLTNESGMVLNSVNVRFAQSLTVPVGPGFAKTAMTRFVDLLPFYQNDASFEVPAQHSGLLWGTVHAPKTQEPGTYRGALQIKARDKTVLSFPMEVTVYPFALEYPQGQNFAMLFTYEFIRMNRVGKGGWAPILEKGLREVIDMRNHGMTALSPHGGQEVNDEEGRPRLPDLLQSLRVAKEQGMMGPFIWYCGPQIYTEKAKNANPYTKFKPEKHLASLKRMVEYVDAICREEELLTVYWLAVDEPNTPARQDIALQTIKALKAAGAKTAQTCNKTNIGALENWVDLVVCSMGHATPEFVAYHQDAGRLVWTYDNSAILDLYEGRTRFVYGYLGWRMSLDGVTSWTYPHHLSGAGKQDVTGQSRAPEYDSRGLPMDNIIWEMVREGIDDYRYLQTMLTVAPSATPVLEELEQLPPQLNAYRFHDSKTDELLYDNFLTPDQFDDLRHRMADRIMQTDVP